MTYIRTYVFMYLLCLPVWKFLIMEGFKIICVHSMHMHIACTWENQITTQAFVQTSFLGLFAGGNKFVIYSVQKYE